MKEVKEERGGTHAKYVKEFIISIIEKNYK